MPFKEWVKRDLIAILHTPARRGILRDALLLEVPQEVEAPLVDDALADKAGAYGRWVACLGWLDGACDGGDCVGGDEWQARGEPCASGPPSK